MTPYAKIPLGRFYKTPPLPCPYLAGRSERKVFTELAAPGPDAEAMYEVLAAAGFRRSHSIVYKPHCDGCSACIPVRVRARAFQPNRSLRRVLRRNAGVVARTLPAVARTEHFELFRRYQKTRHGDSDMALMGFAEYQTMVEDSPVDTFLMEYRAPDDRLVGICLTDRLRDGLSMVYSFFDPAAQSDSPGTAMILWHLQAARQIELDFVYLGYWVSGGTKMAYKIAFRPIEGLGPAGWQLLPLPPANTLAKT